MPAADYVTAEDLRQLMMSAEERRHRERVEAEERARKAHDELVARFRDSHLTEAEKHALINHFKEAAERDEKELLVCRFPSDACTDGGRAINNSLPEWPDTLLGKPRDIYDLWHEHLHPLGFRLRARILEFPGGIPGDAGLFIGWSV
ncbi:hypothetical protein [Caenispirillum bisanense]|uniref:Uncharacterized protein n=1 Tax=Caenispirillum bisanense TaxID=414052 RepID=A0A286GLR4_9PROT|nr:hypothetical protein [Caenispirillum bisanense]SOD95924.1 hypothetical protein SAMN05421508_10564 [Caenispirillum bisanense]